MSAMFGIIMQNDHGPYLAAKVRASGKLKAVGVLRKEVGRKGKFVELPGMLPREKELPLNKVIYVGAERK